MIGEMTCFEAVLLVFFCLSPMTRFHGDGRRVTFYACFCDKSSLSVVEASLLWFSLISMLSTFYLSRSDFSNNSYSQSRSSRLILDFLA